MKHSASKPESGYETYRSDSSYSGMEETIDVYYVIDKVTKEKKPRHFNCLRHENCTNRDKCPVRDEYRTKLKQQLFLAHFR